MISERARQIAPYLTGWERTLTKKGDVATFQRGDFTIHLIGKKDVRLTGRGIDKEMRFYQAAITVMKRERKMKLFNYLKARILKALLLAAILLVAILTAVVLTACGPSQHVIHASQPSKATVATTPVATPTVSALAAWAAAGGQTDLGAVSTDLQISQTDSQTVAGDLGAGNLLAAEGTDAQTMASDAQQLTTDATTALADAPPAPLTGNWDTAMRALAGVGQFEKDAANALQQGNFTQAAVYLQIGTVLLDKTATPALQAAVTQVKGLG